MIEKNYYELLGVSATASLAEITQAFNRRLREINERNAETKIEELQSVIEAFAILSKAEKRADYDKFLETGQAIVLGEQEPVFESTSLVERIKFETTGKNFEKVLPSLIEKVDNLLNRVQDHNVRLKYRGKQIGPDVPMGYVIALEALGLMGAGMVRTLVANLGVKTLFDVEVISRSEQFVKKGDEYYQNGELDLAQQQYFTALNLNNKSALACIRLGVLNKIRGNSEEARSWFQKAQIYEPESPLAEEAQEQLKKL
ncbi:DnaJ domain-containing protein [candidate division CSSED10-310 bacterium]|uniref:DnaJ domain-containing protein n=1 Tax=candidate division CSSED10-310 bacterium TaxID=2855610 RepID=A0ABV6YUR0_UNCC1